MQDMHEKLSERESAFGGPTMDVTMWQSFDTRARARTSTHHQPRDLEWHCHTAQDSENEECDTRPNPIPDSLVQL